jgi:predicted esterase
MRTVDYLVSRPEVDSSRIGCLGISMGGYRATYLMALDERVKAGCIVGFMSTILPMLKAHIDTHSWVHFLPGLHQYLDLPDVASLAMPRALMVQQCSQDRLFTLDGMRESVSQIQAAYEKSGYRSAFAAKFYDAPHQFTLPMQEDAISWLSQNLA